MTDAFYGPRSRANARLLLDAAKAVGVHPREVRTQMGGYLVPESVVDYIDSQVEGVEDETVEEGAKEEQEADAKRPSVTDAKAEWLAYAQHIDLDVTDENTKAEIIEAVKKAEEATD